MAEHHWYGSTYAYWATAKTREELLRKLKQMHGRRELQSECTATVVEVHLPESAHYSIQNYLPHRIKRDDGLTQLVPMGKRQYVQLGRVQKRN